MKITPGRIIVIGALLLNFGIVSYGAYLAYWPMRTITIQEPDLILNPSKQVAAGDALVYQIKYCKYIDKQAAVNRTLVGASITYSLPPSTNQVPPGCKTAISRNTIIPSGIEPGKYYLGLCAAYQLNALRIETICHKSETFTVVARSEGSTTSSSTTTVTTTNTSTPSPTAAPTASPVLEGTNPVTGEPGTPAPTPTPRPGLLQSLLHRLGL